MVSAMQSQTSRCCRFSQSPDTAISTFDASGEWNTPDDDDDAQECYCIYIYIYIYSGVYIYLCCCFLFYFFWLRLNQILHTPTRVHAA